MNTQTGQSMTEFAAGMAVMTLLLLGSITIAGYQETQRRMTIAARQAAFIGSWTGTRADRAGELRRIAELHLKDAALTDAVGRKQYISPPDIGVTALVQPAPGIARASAHALVEPLQVAGGFLGENFDLSADGLLVDSLNADIAPNPYLPAPFNGSPLPLREKFALMVDAWNSSGASHVQRRTAGLVPTTTLSGLQVLWRPLLSPLTLLEPSLSRLCLGLIEADRVPEDRLGPGSTPLPGRCP
jgi:hypothetical protein